MRLIGLLLFALVFLSAPANVQSATRSSGDGILQVAATGGNQSAGASSDVSYLDRFTVWVLTKQRQFHRILTDYLQQLSHNGGDWRVFLSLVGVSFVYGVLHAAGPGHGKAVVSGYLLTHRQTLRRGVALAVAAAFCQGLVAIAIVYGLVVLAGFLPRDTQTAVTWSERASYAMVSLLGAFLLFKALQRLASRLRRQPGHSLDHDHDHDHEDCCHAHVPTAAQAEAVKDLRSALIVVLSIGARPCTGAVIVLVFANVASLYWTGISAVMAMSLGTAITVSALAVFAVSMRKGLESLTAVRARYAEYAMDVLACAGGAVILLIGLVLLSSAFSFKHPLMGL